MRVGEFYGILSLIFANNFNEAMSQEGFQKIKNSNSWIVKNDSEENKNGSILYKDFIENESLAELRTDFRSLRKIFLARTYFETTQDDLKKFYTAINFKPFFGSSDSISNQLLFLSAIFKNELDEKKQELLVKFLIGFFLPYATILSDELIEKSKSSFYKSMGYFLKDYSKSLQNIFNIKHKIN
ncbi:hypothetical protein [Campylobacter pinnipediorum]|uniref:hypothetical protein n=1 Tax=Campylobacter pinnipediorum TaxID=1965231 RepID=UPI00084D8D1F|nr:hypothetical protein [Campylobacter pinnipediorum]AQW82732.1 hypothetical protein CPIN17261_0719 [Campylobacter pinnipediorum subsp. pinnipediorum]AQW84419.1 hypothetical protein CPIN17262_0733 [Campylobacter pinnipediorum subsp. pinnipediorum]